MLQNKYERDQPENRRMLLQSFLKFVEIELSIRGKTQQNSFFYQLLLMRVEEYHLRRLKFCVVSPKITKPLFSYHHGR